MSEPATSRTAVPSAVSIVELLPGEVPPAEGLWVIEFAHRDGRLEGWLQRVDWWTNGLLSRKLSILCPDGKADLLVGLDWMLPEGILLLPSSGETGDAAALDWAGRAFQKLAQMKPARVSLAVNALGGSSAQAKALAGRIAGLAPGGTPPLQLWVGGLPSPRTDGYGDGSGAGG